MTYVLYHTKIKAYLVDDESVAGVKKTFDGFVALQVGRSNENNPAKSSLMQV